MAGLLASGTVRVMAGPVVVLGPPFPLVGGLSLVCHKLSCSGRVDLRTGVAVESAAYVATLVVFFLDDILPL